jgi:hypothetical protein
VKTNTRGRDRLGGECTGLAATVVQRFKKNFKNITRNFQICQKTAGPKKKRKKLFGGTGNPFPGYYSNYTYGTIFTLSGLSYYPNLLFQVSPDTL